MANHLTPDELSEETGIERDEVIRICLEEHVPIYHGKIDKTLFSAQLQALGRCPRSTELRRALLPGRGRLLARGRRGLLLRRGGLLRRGRDGRAQRLHQVDDGRRR